MKRKEEKKEEIDIKKLILELEKLNGPNLTVTYDEKNEKYYIKLNTSKNIINFPNGIGIKKESYDTTIMEDPDGDLMDSLFDKLLGYNYKIGTKDAIIPNIDIYLDVKDDENIDKRFPNTFAELKKYFEEMGMDSSIAEMKVMKNSQDSEDIRYKFGQVGNVNVIEVINPGEPHWDSDESHGGLPATLGGDTWKVYDMKKDIFYIDKESGALLVHEQLKCRDSNSTSEDVLYDEESFIKPERNVRMNRTKIDQVMNEDPGSYMIIRCMVENEELRSKNSRLQGMLGTALKAIPPRKKEKLPGLSDR